MGLIAVADKAYVASIDIRLGELIQRAESLPDAAFVDLD